MQIKNIELLSSYFKGFSTDEKIIIMTSIAIKLLEKASYTNDEIEWLFTQAKSDFLSHKDRN